MTGGSLANITAEQEGWDDLKAVLSNSRATMLVKALCYDMKKYVDDDNNDDAAARNNKNEEVKGPIGYDIKLTSNSV